MMYKLWVVLLVALTGAHLGHGLPVRSTPHSYPHNTNGPILEGWKESSLYAAVPALALVITAVGLLIGCTWCYRHKDCKQNEGADNQLFTASATHLHERRSHPPDSGFSEPANNNISEDNNNGPISLREMQNIANNNAAAYITSENEERNRVSRESVVEFEPLPTGIRVVDPLERCVDWFGDEDFPRNRLQYLREIGRGWFGRVVEGEIEDEGTTSTVAVKILNQNASLEDKARFLDEARLYRDSSHENILGFVASCLQEDPWMLIFELCSTDLQTYLTANRAKSAALDESGVTLRLMCDVTSALTYLHSRGHAFGNVCTSNVLVRGEEDAARAVLGHYGLEPRPPDHAMPAQHSASSDVQALGSLLWQTCAWGAPPPEPPVPPPHLACPHWDHLYQVMQLCWEAGGADGEGGAGVSAAQVLALLQHLQLLQAGGARAHFEQRWQRLKPNHIPKLDEHRAIVHAPSARPRSASSGSGSVSDRHVSAQVKSDSLTNLHGSLEDVTNVYLTHDETSVSDCHPADVLERSKDEDHDRSDGSVDPWLKDIIAGSQDDVSYYRDVSDVIKNLDNILNSEKTSSSESSHQASPSRDNLSLDCKKDYPMQSSMVKSPGISNFQNILEIGFEESPEKKREDDDDRDTIGTLSHSFERHSETTSQHTLENLTPDTPIKDMELPCEESDPIDLLVTPRSDDKAEEINIDAELPKENKIDNSDSVIPNLTKLCIAPMPSVNEAKSEVNVTKDCQSLSDNKLADIVCNKKTVEAKSVSEEIKEPKKSETVDKTMKVHSSELSAPVKVQNKEVLPVLSKIVENNKIEVSLPSTPLDDKDAQHSLPEPTSSNNQKIEINDLIKPGASTTDSTITRVAVTLEAQTSTPEVAVLNDVSEIPTIPIEIEPIHCIKDIKLNEKPFPTGEIKEELLPETVQNNTSQAASLILHTNVENEMNNDSLSSVPVSELEVQNSKNNDEFTRILVDTFETVQTNANNQMATPALIFTESEEEIQNATNINKVSEEFVEEIIKQAEISALSGIKTAYTKIVAPGDDVQTKELSSNTFLETGIKSLKSNSIDNVSSISEILPQKAVNISSTDDTTLETVSKEILTETPQETTQVTDQDNIAKNFLIEAMQDAPKSMDEFESMSYSKNDENCVAMTPSIFNLEATGPKVDLQDVVKSSKQAVLQKQDEFEISEPKCAPMPSMLLQTSIDHESSASTDTSQSTFLIKDTLLKEECNIILTQDSEPLVIHGSVQKNTLPEDSSNQILLRVLENDAKLLESTNLLPGDDLKPLLAQPNVNKDNVNLDQGVEEVNAEKKHINLKNDVPESDHYKEDTADRTDNSTAYMDLTNDIQAEIMEQNVMDENIKDVIKTCLENSDTENACSIVKYESTVYLDLPNVIRQMDDFLHYERQLSSHVDVKDAMCSSTPKSSTDDTQKSDEEKSDELSETKVPDYGPGVTLTKLEQQYVLDSMSPFESPTKSHPTDTYDENSSVVLGPFENCTIELFKGVKSATDLCDIPKEELLAFSSNFSEMNLETPSPLRDGNFLNEVPDIVHDDIHFDVTSEAKDDTDSKTGVSDATDQSLTEKRVSPSTPPNSPGYFLASTSQQKYLVDIDLNQPTEPAPVESDSGLSSLHKEIELNQIELQITSKLAMAENENNLNIEYSGPLTVEGLVQDDVQREEESAPETFLAGNGECIEKIREFALDEDCVNALRNELELKLPLAQVAAIEPQCESESDNSWSSELPPPPELIVSYPGALSPIAEETGPQLSAYENDAQWNTSARTDSSESYPEPCDHSTDEPTDMPTGLHSARDTCTYTLQRDTASREITMSADSLNGSPRKSNEVDDRTFTKDDDKDACERISQVSPFILSPTTDTSAPENSDVTGVSTLSKTTVPTDAKISKPSETQCLSKATSIDSWCSNDTLYNVEEAFDDLGSDPELPAHFDIDKELDNSESSHTLTLNDEKELSHVSTYIVQDSQSDEDRFSPDSITANDNQNNTYTKAKTDVNTPPSALTKSEGNDSKTQTKDLAYETLMSGVASYSNCTTELLSADNGWMFPHPELVRRFPMDGEADITAPINTDLQEIDPDHSPQLKNEPRVKKMDSVEISCLEDHLLNTSPENQGSVQTEINDSSNYHYVMAGSVTSTPLAEAPSDGDVEPVMMTLPQEVRTPENLPNNIPNYPSFMYSAELRPQDRSYAPTEGSRSELLGEGDSRRDGSDATSSYTEFQNAAAFKPQETSGLKSSQNGSDDFRQFENSVRVRPQDLSTTSSALLLISERDSALNEGFIRPSQSASQDELTSLVISPPSITNLRESHVGKVNTVIITDLEEDETEQPHSIIIAEVSKDSPNRTYDSHTVGEMNRTYDSHTSRWQKEGALRENTSDNSKELTLNGTDDQNHDVENVEAKSPEVQTTGGTQKEQTTVLHDAYALNVANGSVTNLLHINNNAFDIKCNGNSEKFATVNFINESFEELIESNVDDGDCKDKTTDEASDQVKVLPCKETTESPSGHPEVSEEAHVNGVEEKIVNVTEDFLQNEKNFCQLDAYFPLLSDIKFTGPASEIMSTSFSQDLPAEPEPERDGKPDVDVKEWDSDTDSHTSNSSSGEFIWKGGDGQETSVVPSTHFDDRGGSGGGRAEGERAPGASGASGSGSGSEGDEVEFVPSSWDCRAEPAKSSLRSLPLSTQDKKRVVFKRQKYHCVYEYPRELPTVDADSPAYLPDLSTYAEWDGTSAEEAELGYGRLFGASPLDLYPLRGAAFAADYDEDFFISSSSRPFESLGVMSTTSQFFPGMQLKPGLLDLADDLPDDFPPPPSPLLAPAPAPASAAAIAPAHTSTPSLDFTTPDSGVEDITPGSTSTDEDFKTNKLPESEVQWRGIDSGSSSESVSPSSPGGEALGGLRHTRDKLKLDLPPSPHIPSPRHNRVFNFVLDKPKRHRVPDEKPAEVGSTPLVMTDDTPMGSTSLPLQKECEDVAVPEPTFLTFGKSTQKADSEQKMILTDALQAEQEAQGKVPSPVKVEAVKGEGTVLDSGDEDSGIESSSKATLERNKTPNVS